MLISIVTPCFNEEHYIEKFFHSIQEVSIPNIAFEIIYVNDGSKDQTLETIQRLQKEHKMIRFISFSRNFGKEAAMLAGLEYSKGDAAIIMDSDLQHPSALIPEMIHYFQTGYDQVIAQRNRASEPKSRSFLSFLYYKYMNLFVDVEFTNGIGDFRLLSRKSINALLKLKEYNRFSKGLFSWIGFSKKIIHYDNVVRGEGKSKWSFRSLINYGLDGVISFNNKPLRIVLYMGLFTTFLSILYILYIFIRILLYGINEPGYFTIVASILLFGGIQLISLGVIGEYIGRIYYEAKQRPHYIVEETDDDSKKHHH